MRASPSDLDSLSRKYRALGELRRAQAEPQASAVRALAAEFPGALRELDVLPLSTIDTRLADVVRAERGEAAAAWIRPMLAYHARMRQLLAVKRLLGGERRPDLARATAIARELGPDCDAGLVQRAASPPAGRLNRLAFAMLARELDQVEGELERVLFPRAGQGDQSSA